jgi:hypothetical protein
MLAADRSFSVCYNSFSMNLEIFERMEADELRRYI